MKFIHFVLVLGGFLLVLTGCDEREIQADTWEQSPLFKGGNYSMLGIKDAIGFIYDENEQSRFYANKENKYMWHIWFGDRQARTLTVKATHQESNEERILIDAQVLGGPNNGADAHLPSSMSLPRSGMWKLDTSIDGDIFETIYVKVHEE